MNRRDNLSIRIEQAKGVVGRVRTAMVDFDDGSVRSTLDEAFSQDVVVRAGAPFGTETGATAWYDRAYRPLLAAWPDLERRDHIVMAGPDGDGALWVGCCGHYAGTFRDRWLGIPPTRRPVSMRFHEFYRFDAGRIVEVHALWDIPEVMMQARAWPLAPSLGREWQVPGPATQDGIVPGPYEPDRADTNRALVTEMLSRMILHPSQGGPEIMQLDRFWHPRLSWYGPAGVGTARGIEGFRRIHQAPFLAAMPDRGQDPSGTSHHFFADRNYVAVTGWPNMKQTLTGGGWLGIPPVGKAVTIRSLDFWRVENGLIRENWVLFDLVDIYAQIGVDVFGRMAELAPD